VTYFILLQKVRQFTCDLQYNLYHLLTNGFENMKFVDIPKDVYNMLMSKVFVHFKSYTLKSIIENNIESFNCLELDVIKQAY